MADLEEKELLEKTHSSSGRIPSERGYRYYVDHVISPSIKQRELNIIQNTLNDNIIEMEQIVQLSAELLSQLTNYTAIILGPNVDEAKLKDIQLITLTSQTAVAILITDTGHVEHKSFTVPTCISVSKLEISVNIVHYCLIWLPILQ